MSLAIRFEKLLKEYTSDTVKVNSLWKSILTKYSEKHRAYHNLTHLEEIFRYFDIYKNRLDELHLICFSIFYHDVIYNVWKKDNEEQSARFALEKLSEILSFSELEIIEQQIIATKTHEGTNNDTKYLLDFDLAILGQNENIYKKYTESIRQEYKLVPSFIYKKGRIKVLEHFISKPFIYKTTEFIDLYEHQAKVNLTNELKFLKNGF